MSILQRAFSAFLSSSVTVQESAFMWCIGCLLGWKAPLKIPSFTSGLKNSHEGGCMRGIREALQKPWALLCAVVECFHELCEPCLCNESLSWETVRVCLTPGGSECTGFFLNSCVASTLNLSLARNAKRDFSIFLGVWWTTWALQLDGRKPVWFGWQNTGLQHWSLWICYFGGRQKSQKLEI